MVATWFSQQTRIVRWVGYFCCCAFLTNAAFLPIEHLFIVHVACKRVCTSSLVPLELGLHMHVSFTAYILPVGAISQICCFPVYFPKLYLIRTVYARCILSGDRKPDCTVYKRSTHIYVIYIVQNYERAERSACTNYELFSSLGSRFPFCSFLSFSV